MKEQNNCYLMDDIFSAGIVAGFTKNTLGGDLPGDMKRELGQTQVAYLDQPHSADIVYTEKEGLFHGDGLLTKKKGLALVIKTADCLPVFLEEPEEGIFGIIHMGWRSAESGILDGIGIDLSRAKVAAGPGMRRCCYQMGREFRRSPAIGPFLKEEQGRYYFDPVRFLREALVKKGLRKENFFDLGICSFCSGLDVFSYRRTGTSLRTLSFILHK